MHPGGDAGCPVAVKFGVCNQLRVAAASEWLIAKSRHH